MVVWNSLSLQYCLVQCQSESGRSAHPRVDSYSNSWDFPPNSIAGSNFLSPEVPCSQLLPPVVLEPLLWRWGTPECAGTTEMSTTPACVMVVQPGHSSCWTMKPAWKEGWDDCSLFSQTHLHTWDPAHHSRKRTSSRNPYTLTPTDTLFPFFSPHWPTLLHVSPYASLQCLSPGNADDDIFYTGSLEGTLPWCAPSVTPFVWPTQIMCHTPGACDARMVSFKRRE